MLTTNKYLGGGMISTVIVAGAILAFLFTLGGDTRCAYAQASCGVGDDEIFAGSLGLQSGTAYTLTQSSAGNVADRAIAWGDFAGEPTINTAAQTLTSKTINGGSTLDGVVGGVTPAIGTFTNFTATTIDGVVGSVTPAAGTFTTINAAGNVTISRAQSADAVLLTVENTSIATGSASVRQDFKVPANSTAREFINFQQGDGSGSAGNMNYLLEHNLNGGYFRLRSHDTDGASTHGDIIKVDDGTATVDFLAGINTGGDSDFQNNDLNNVGNAGTDFTSTGATFGTNVAIGSIDSDTLLNMNATISPAGDGVGFHAQPTINCNPGANCFGEFSTVTVNEPASGATGYALSYNIDTLQIGANGGSITNAATVRIAGQPTAGTSVNAALWVDDGLVQIDDELVVGAPTGGAQGPGTINAQGVYDDGVLLSDFVFEDGYEYLTIGDMREYFESENHLPTIDGKAVWDAEGSFSLGKLATQLWETVEVQAIYIAELDARLNKLEHVSPIVGDVILP